MADRTLAAFLEARFAQDEAVIGDYVAACEASDIEAPDTTSTGWPIHEEWERFTDPAALRAEIAAKRLIVAEAIGLAAVIDGEWGDSHSSEQIEAGECRGADLSILQLLALRYADHEEYLPEWQWLS